MRPRARRQHAAYRVEVREQHHLNTRQSSSRKGLHTRIKVVKYNGWDRLEPMDIAHGKLSKVVQYTVFRCGRALHIIEQKTFEFFNYYYSVSKTFTG